MATKLATTYSPVGWVRIVGEIIRYVSAAAVIKTRVSPTRTRSLNTGIENGPREAEA
jgi:hypothetical protein